MIRLWTKVKNQLIAKVRVRKRDLVKVVITKHVGGVYSITIKVMAQLGWRYDTSPH